MSDGLWGLLGVVVGAFLGFGGTMVTNWQAGRSERIKVRNKVIYYLLEIHHLLSKLKGPMPDIGKIYAEYLTDRFGEEAAFHIPSEIISKMQLQMDEMVRRNVTTELLALQEKYPDALAALSEIDPITCFQVSALATNLQKATEFTTETSERLEGIVKEWEAEEIRNVLDKVLSPRIVIDNLELIEDALAELAKDPFNSKLGEEVKRIVSTERQQEVLEEVESFMYDQLDTHFEKVLASTDEVQNEEEE